MPHCNPAPPHPDPGMVYNAICPPGAAELLPVLALIAIAALILSPVKRVESDDEE